MFKRQPKELSYSKSVTVTETVFKKGMIAGKFSLKNCRSELHAIPTDGSVEGVLSQTDGQTHGLTAGCVHHVTLS